MVICLFGESCTGKTTIANALKERTGAKIFTGKDYTKLAKGEAEAKQAFRDLLKSHSESDDTMIYVVTEKEHLSLLPEHAIRVLVTAELSIIKERFAKRMNGNLPAPVANMLEKKHGMFDHEKYDLLITGENESTHAACDKILNRCRE